MQSAQLNPETLACRDIFCPGGRAVLQSSLNLVVELCYQAMTLMTLDAGFVRICLLSSTHFCNSLCSLGSETSLWRLVQNIIKVINNVHTKSLIILHGHIPLPHLNFCGRKILNQRNLFQAIQLCYGEKPSVGFKFTPNIKTQCSDVVFFLVRIPASGRT